MAPLDAQLSGCFWRNPVTWTFQFWGCLTVVGVVISKKNLSNYLVFFFKLALISPDWKVVNYVPIHVTKTSWCPSKGKHKSQPGNSTVKTWWKRSAFGDGEMVSEIHVCPFSRLDMGDLQRLGIQFSHDLNYLEMTHHPSISFPSPSCDFRIIFFSRSTPAIFGFLGEVFK